MTTVRILGYAFLSGARDYGTIYTWKSWLGGWFLRVLAQVVFFTLAGRLLDSPERTWFLLVGNAVVLCAMESIWALNMVGWERSVGTLPLLAASPTSPMVVLAARGAYLVCDGFISAAGALLLVSRMFGFSLPWPRTLLVFPLLLLISLSAYGFGTFLGGLLLGFRWINGVTVNLASVAVMALCGVNVPLTYYPGPVAWAAGCLPLTHGLLAVRAVFDGRLGSAAGQALAESIVGSCWFVLCLLTFHRFVDRGRRMGTLEYSS